MAATTIEIFRGVASYLVLKIGDNALLHKKLVGEDFITVPVYSTTPLDLQINDYIVHDGINYIINSTPEETKNGTNSFNYDLKFESENYDLGKVDFLDSDGNTDFFLTGNVDDFIDLIVTNMNRDGSGWTRGTTDQTDTSYKNLSFSLDNCLSAINKLVGEFSGEYFIISKAIGFTDEIGTVTATVLQYPDGLLNLKRSTPDNANIVTRLRAWGSERNIGADYRSTGRSRRLIFDVAGNNYLENNVGTYGVLEASIIFDDIYPHREGTISAVDGSDILKFSDAGMDFDLNSFLLPGIKAIIHFNSGNLAGYEFQIESYDNGTKEFTIITFKDDQSADLPNATLKPAIGDDYVILQIEMPQSYIDAAEAELEAACQDQIDIVSVPKVTYGGDGNKRYFEDNTLNLVLGSYYTIVDTDWGISISTRLISYTQQLNNQYAYDFDLSNNQSISLIQRNINFQQGTTKTLSGVELELLGNKKYIVGDEIESLTITAREIGNLEVTTGKINNFAVTNAKIGSLAVSSDKIGALAVTAGKIGALAVSAGNIQNATITSTQIASATILGSNIASLTISSTNIANATITGAKIASATITSGNIAIGTITGGNIASGTITGGNIASLTITAGLIQNLTITAAQIANLTITGGPGGKIAGSTITETNIVANTITAASIAANTITASQIAANTITGNEILANTITADKLNVVTVSAITANLGSITSGSITGTTITGNVFQTASSGQRIVISNSDNALKFYDSGGANVVRIDDNILGGGGSPGIQLSNGWTYTLVSQALALAPSANFVDFNNGYFLGLVDTGGFSVDASNTTNVSGSTGWFYGYNINLIQTTLTAAASYFGFRGALQAPTNTGAVYGAFLEPKNTGSGNAYGVYIGLGTAGGTFYPIYSASTAASFFAGSVAFNAGLTTNADIAVGSTSDVTVGAGHGVICRISAGTLKLEAGATSGAVQIISPGNLTVVQSEFVQIKTVGGTIRGTILAASNKIQLNCASNNRTLAMLDTGVLTIPNLGSDPTGVAGGICMVNNQLKYWNGASWVNA